MLNRAHALHRQAEKATRKGNFDEAVKYHKEAADILNQLLENILEEKFAESIRLQAQLHEKEKTILRNQKKKAEKVYRESALIRNMSNKDVAGGQTPNILDAKFGDDVEVGAANGSRAFIAVPSDYLQNNSSEDVVVGVASKKPKDDKVIIEELQVANCHLRKMVDSLFHELSTCQRENLELKARVRYLESMQVGPAGTMSSLSAIGSHKTLLQSQSAQPSPSHHRGAVGLRSFKPELQQQPSPAPSPPIRNEVNAGTIGATTLPSSQITPPPPPSSSSDETQDCHLPPLPPLEMPTFDFDKRNSEA